MSLRLAQKVAAYNDKILQDNSWSPHGPILRPTWATAGSTWPFQTNIDANLPSKLLSSSPQDNNKTSKHPLPKQVSREFRHHVINQKFWSVFGTSTLSLRCKPTNAHTHTPKNQFINPQAVGVGSTERAERLNVNIAQGNANQ